MTVAGRDILKFVQTSLRSQEAALMSVERILDRMPGVFILFSSDLRFLRVNDLGCQVLGVHESELVGKNLKECFSTSTVGSIISLVDNLIAEKLHVSRTVEVSLAGPDNVSRGLFSMRVSVVEGSGKNRFYALVATDLSEIVALRTQVRALFSEINGAVLVFNSRSEVDSPNFDAIEEFLGVSLAHLRTAGEVWNSLQPVQLEDAALEAWKKLPYTLSSTAAEFEKNFGLIPNKIWLKHGKTGEQKCFKTSLTLIGVDSIDRAVIFLQDVTAQEHQAIEKIRLEEALKVARERQRLIDSLSDNVLETVEREFSAVNTKMVKTLESSDDDALSRVLHSYKGNARCMGFLRLAEEVQVVEMELNKARTKGILDWDFVTKGVQHVNQEWIALHALLMKRLDAISGAGKDAVPAELFGTLNSLFDSAGKDLVLEELMMKFALMNETKSGELAPIAKMQAQDTRARLGKACDFSVKVDNFVLDRKIFNILNEAIAHILSNAIKHGIEESDVRAARKKPPTGFVRCTIRTQDGGVLLNISDDGGGIDTERVKLKAVQKGVYTPEQLSRMTEEEINLLIFHSGISTASEVTMVAGLGVGLHAVMESVRDVRGKITVTSRPGEGTQFEIWLPRHSIPFAKKFNSLGPLLNEFKSSFPKGMPLEICDELKDSGARSYYAAFDPVKAIFSLARIYGRLATPGESLPKFAIDLFETDAKRMTVTIDLNAGQEGDMAAWLKTREGSYVSEMVRLLGGSIKLNKTNVVVTLMKCFEKSKIPTILLRESRILPEKRRVSLRLIADVLRNEGLLVGLDEKEVPSFHIEVSQELMESLVSEPVDVNQARDRVLEEVPKLALLAV